MSEIYVAQDANQFPALLGNYGNAGTSNGTSTPSKIAADEYGNLKVQALNSLIPKSSTGGSVSYPDGTTEVYNFLSGTASVGSITLTYTDSTKGSLNTWSA